MPTSSASAQAAPECSELGIMGDSGDIQACQDLTTRNVGEVRTALKSQNSPEGVRTGCAKTTTTLPSSAEDPLGREHALLLKNTRVVGSRILRANEIASEVEDALRRGLEDDSFSMPIERLAQELRSWSSIKSALREATLETKDLAVRCAGFVSVFLRVCFPPEARDDRTVLRSFKDDEALQDLHSLSAKIAEMYIRIAERMSTFKANFLEDVNSRTKPIVIMVDNAEMIIAHIAKPLPPLTSKQIALLDNSSVPGLMKCIVAFLPEKSTHRFDEFVEGKRARITQGTNAGGQRNVNCESLFSCMTDIGYMIPADLKVLLQTPQRPLDQKKRDYAVQSTYAFLEFALRELDESLTAALIDTKPDPEAKGWRAWDIRAFFHHVVRLLQTPLRPV
ncbi:hypothetical protein SCHPADRAFT_911133 [Schizopora paradoxa]|uniref:Uncharacterized protein n=1 Tax=Schizopora paradoxa TaxID=27342 RepID=A0A0H2R0F3_9AGAM|nr:hypothetical protein SCHPADRAFT_911133 [Schizopora paradoxa]